MAQVSVSSVNTLRDDYIHPLTDVAAASALCTDTLARGNLTAAALTIMVKILQLDLPASYRDAMVADGRVSNEFKDAVRKAEETILKPLYEAGQKKGMKQLDMDAGFITFMRTLRNGGVYSKVKSEACLLFAVTGTLPCVINEDGTPDTDKMLSSALIGERVRKYKEAKVKALGDTSDKWIAKIVAMSTAFVGTKDAVTTDKEELKAAIQALKAMLDKVECLQAHRVIVPGNVIAATSAVVAQASASSKLTGKALTKALTKEMALL